MDANEKRGLDWPEDLHDELDWLHRKFLDLCFDWAEFRAVFGRNDDDEYLEQLWPFAGRFLTRLHRLFVDRLVLGICRCCDPPQTGKFSNLTLDRIVERVQERGDGELADRLAVHAERVRTSCEPLRKYRDKAVAHLDLEVSLGDALRELPSDSFTESMDGLQEFFTALNAEYRGGSGIDYENLTGYADGAVGALRLMANTVYLMRTDWQRFEEQDRERREAWGEIHPKARGE